MPMRRSWIFVRAAGAAIALAVMLVGCDNRILRVTAPDVVQPSALSGASALPTVTAAVYGDFGYAYAGSAAEEDEGMIEDGGLLGDEFHSSDTFETRIQIDQRAITNDTSQNEIDFRRVQRARTTAEFAVQQYERFEPNAALGAEAFSFVGFAYLLAGENYCSGIPFSNVLPDGTIQYGTLETTVQVFADAISRFDSALTVLGKDTIGGDKAQIPIEQNLASIGLARALVDAGNYAAAAAAVASVPTTFEFDQGYSSGNLRTSNGVFEYNTQEGRYSVADLEGGVGLPYRSANDPRVLWSDSGVFGFDATDSLYLELKYPSYNAPIAIATGIEARLIQAEAALKAGDMATFLSNISAARQQSYIANGAAAAAPVTAVPAGMTAVQFLFQERAFDLWLTAHRLGDMRRLITQYGQSVNAVFPNGSYAPRPGNFGPDVDLPVPVTEEGNPNFKACDPTIP
jgi:hypothetical protein